MTGENEQGPRDPQPGDRLPAPGELALVQAFINTNYDLGANGGEVFISGDALRDWLAERGLIAGGERFVERDVERALAVREGLRTLAFANNGEAPDAVALDAMRLASRGAATQIRIEPDGPRFEADPATGIDAAIGVLYAITAWAMIEGSWRRLKACPGRDCGWAFFDHSRNQSARWCSMSVCGGREKARTYYERRTRKRR
jgi:predicted RNA-binding Zn ribbon-like protein